MIRHALALGAIATMTIAAGALVMASDSTPTEGTNTVDAQMQAQTSTMLDGVYTLTPFGQKVSDASNGALPALETATFGAGCFWGVEARYRATDGVIATAVGYAGGRTDKPTYKEVCADSTGHAEVVELKFAPAVVTYEQLLEVFWNNHNPTQLNRQGVDVGSQYRSAIFYHSEEQKAVAEKTRQAVTDSGKWNKPIVTEITKASTFFPAEDYHQQYLEKRGQTSCGVPGAH